jgi:hypothetical protein
MSSDFEQNLDKYAEVIIKVGLNLQPGQRLRIGPPFFGLLGAPIELAPLARRIAVQAYQAGARLVDVMWGDDQLRLTRFQHAPIDSFAEFPDWRAQGALEATESGDAVLVIVAEDPELLSAQDSELVDTFRRASMQHNKRAMDLRSKNAMNWTVVTPPVAGWMEKVFPDLPSEIREARLWDTLCSICRVSNPALSDLGLNTPLVFSPGAPISTKEARCSAFDSTRYGFEGWITGRAYLAFCPYDQPKRDRFHRQYPHRRGLHSPSQRQDAGGCHRH